MSGTRLYVISVAARIVGVHPQTLRGYERAGLIEPQRSPGGARRFDDADVATVRRVLELTSAGVNLEGVRLVLALEAENARLRALLAESAPERGEGHN